MQTTYSHDEAGSANGKPKIIRDDERLRQRFRRLIIVITPKQWGAFVPSVFFRFIDGAAPAQLQDLQEKVRSIFA